MLVGEVGDIGYEVGFIDAVRNLSDHNFVMSFSTLDLCLGTHHDTATTCLVGITHTLQTIDISACGEVGTRDILHQTVGVDIGVVDIGTAAVDDLREVVGRHVGCHTYGDTITTIHEEVRYLSRHDGGLFERVVEVVHHIHSVLIEIVHDVLTHLRESALRVTHGGWRVTVNGTIVTLTINQRVTHVPVLGHTNEGTIDGAVAVGVILTEHLTYDARTFLIRLG